MYLTTFRQLLRNKTASSSSSSLVSFLSETAKNTTSLTKNDRVFVFIPENELLLQKEQKEENSNNKVEISLKLFHGSGETYNMKTNIVHPALRCLLEENRFLMNNNNNHKPTIIQQRQKEEEENLFSPPSRAFLSPSLDISLPFASSFLYSYSNSTLEKEDNNNDTQEERKFISSVTEIDDEKKAQQKQQQKTHDSKSENGEFDFIKKVPTSLLSRNSNNRQCNDFVNIDDQIKLILHFVRNEQQQSLTKINSINIKSIACLQVDFLKEENLIMSEFGPEIMSNNQITFGEDLTIIQNHKNNNNNPLKFPLCYSYLDYDTHQPCFAMLREHNPNCKLKVISIIHSVTATNN